MSAEAAREARGTAHPPGRLPRWLPRALLGLAGVILVAHSLVYNFVTDDAYISFVFSRNFAEHGELVFNLGDQVEGYTNFSWTVLLGLLMKVGIAPELSSRVLGTLCALGTLAVVVRTMQRALDRPDSPWAALPSLLLATSSGFACWSSGGLETQLFTLCVVAAVDATVASVRDPRAFRRTGWLLALAAMTRPEGPLIVAVLGVARMIHFVIAFLASRRDEPRPWLGFPLRDELIAAAWFFLLWGPWFAWRSWYYGYPFPNTYYVKASGDWSRPELAGQMFDHGLHYIWAWLDQTRVVYASLVVAVGLFAIRPRTPRFVLATCCVGLALFYVPYAIAVGGDFMGLHRFIMPLSVVAAIALVLGLEWITARQQIAGLELAALVVIAFVSSQVNLTRASVREGNTRPDRGIDTPAFLIVYTEDRAKIGRAMAPCFQPDDFSIVGGAGAQPYFGRMRGIDVFGLVSDKIAHREPRIRARPGHTKWGSDRTLAEYDPTFVFACYELHANPQQPTLPCGGFWRGRGFEQVTVKIPGLRERGEYYTFLAKKSRAFQCPNRVH
ncbi:MAG: hypothetical protein WKG01_04645 [Kofleriaceae bacterium]